MLKDDHNKALNNAKKISIRVQLSREEYMLITNNANKMKLSLQEYSRMKVLDSQDGLDSVSRKIGSMMPDYYNKVKEIPDPDLKTYFERTGHKIWQLLE